MNTPISYSELLEAYEWVSSGEVAAVSCAAYVHKGTGHIDWSGDGIDEELPEDIEDGSQYIAVPSKKDLKLGRDLALRFAEEFLPQQLDSVYAFFRRPGAYSHFKSLLDRAGQLEAWYGYENKATELALEEWCAVHGFVLVRASSHQGGPVPSG
jgi:hypothetical protein